MWDPTLKMLNLFPSFVSSPFLMYKRELEKAIRTLCSRVYYYTISFPLSLTRSIWHAWMNSHSQTAWTVILCVSVRKSFVCEFTHFDTPIRFYIFPTCLNCYRKAREVYLRKQNKQWWLWSSNKQTGHAFREHAEQLLAAALPDPLSSIWAHTVFSSTHC